MTGRTPAPPALQPARGARSPLVKQIVEAIRAREAGPLDVDYAALILELRMLAVAGKPPP